MLRVLEETSESTDPLSDGLSQRMFDVIKTSDVLWKSPFPNKMMVFKCAADIIVKATRGVDDDTEYTTLQYLKHHKPTVPAPTPLGQLLPTEPGNGLHVIHTICPVSPRCRQSSSLQTGRSRNPM